MKLTILGSGSAGNCAYLETENTRLLIDCGLRASEIRKRLAGIGRTPESLDGIFITHEHNDHVQGLAGLCAKIKAPVVGSVLTMEKLKVAKFTGVHEGQFKHGDFNVEAFSVPHDAVDPLGYVFESGGSSVALVTDLGHVTDHIIKRLRGVNILVLETNYDIKMLMNHPMYIESLKARIMGPLGHLANDMAANLLEHVMTPDLKHVFLAHLSKDCNTSELARETVQGWLTRMGASHVTLHHTFQDRACETLDF